MNYVIKKMKIHNYYDIYSLWKRSLSEDSFSVSDNKENLEVFLKRNEDFCFTANIDEKIIGTVLGAWDGRRGYIHHLAVDSGYRKNGIGSALLNEVLTKFKKLNIPKCHLFVYKGNTNAVQIYKHKGFFIRDELHIMTKVLD